MYEAEIVPIAVKKLMGIRYKSYIEYIYTSVYDYFK